MSKDDSDSFENCVEDQNNDIESLLEELKKWIKDQKKFPKNIPDVVLKRFIKVCDNDLQRTKDLLLLNYKLRSSAPHLFANRDMMSEGIQAAKDVFRFYPLPKLTKEGYKITFGAMHDQDPKKFDYLNMVRMALMMFDVRFFYYDDKDTCEIANGDIIIMDMKGMSFWHFLKMVKNFTTAKFYMHYVQEAAPIKILQMNVMNPSPVVYRIHSMFSPFMKKEVLDTMVFHRSFESLHEKVPKELLPPEYGGTSDVNFDELHQNAMKKLEDLRDYFMDDDNWRFSE